MLGRDGEGPQLQGSEEAGRSEILTLQWQWTVMLSQLLVEPFFMFAQITQDLVLQGAGAFNFPLEPICEMQLWIPAYVPCYNWD